MTIDGSGNIYGCGIRTSPSNGTDIVVFKINQNGLAEWMQPYNAAADNEISTGVYLDAAGNVYVNGYTGPYPQRDILLLKYNNSGSLQWAKRYNFGLDETNPKAVIFGNNIYYTLNWSAVGIPEFLTVKCNLNGDTLWTRSIFNFTGMGCYPTDIKADNSGNIYVTGYTYDESSLYNYLTIKYSPNGDSLWSVSYNGPFS